MLPTSIYSRPKTLAAPLADDDADPETGDTPAAVSATDRVRPTQQPEDPDEVQAQASRRYASGTAADPLVAAGAAEFASCLDDCRRRTVYWTATRLALVQPVDQAAVL